MRPMRYSVGVINSSPVVIIRSKKRVSIDVKPWLQKCACLHQSSSKTECTYISISVSINRVSQPKNKDPKKSYTPDLYVLFTTERMVHNLPIIRQQMQHFLALCGGVDYSSVETEDACFCAGPARNRKERPTPPKRRRNYSWVNGAPVWQHSAADSCGGESFTLRGTQIQMCTTEGKYTTCRLDRERG